MNAQALRAPRAFAGYVDGSRDRETPTPRTLLEAFGPAGESGVLVPMDADQSTHPSEVLVTRASAAAGVFVIALLLIERFMP